MQKEKNAYKHNILLTEQTACVHQHREKIVQKTWSHEGFEPRTLDPV